MVLPWYQWISGRFFSCGIMPGALAHAGIFRDAKRDNDKEAPPPRAFFVPETLLCRAGAFQDGMAARNRRWMGWCVPPRSSMAYGENAGFDRMTTPLYGAVEGIGGFGTNARTGKRCVAEGEPCQWAAMSKPLRRKPPRLRARRGGRWSSGSTRREKANDKVQRWAARDAERRVPQRGSGTMKILGRLAGGTWRKASRIDKQRDENPEAHRQRRTPEPRPRPKGTEATA